MDKTLDSVATKAATSDRCHSFRYRKIQHDRGWIMVMRIKLADGTEGMRLVSVVFSDTLGAEISIELRDEQFRRLVRELGAWCDEVFTDQNEAEMSLSDGAPSYVQLPLPHLSVQAG